MADTCTVCCRAIIRGEAFHWFGNEPYHLCCLWVEYTRARKYLDTAVARGNRLENENQQLMRLYGLASELDSELDGVSLPASAAAIMNAIRRIVEKIEDELAGQEE